MFEDYLKGCPGRIIDKLFLRNLSTIETNGVLNEGWLKYSNENIVAKQIYIMQLHIESSDISDIAKNAFVGDLFTRLRYLLFNAMSRTLNFRKGMLNGLSQFNKLELRNFGTSTFDEFFLEPVKSTIRSIEINESKHINAKSLKNLYSIAMNGYPEIVFHGNVINMLEKDTFVNQTTAKILRIMEVNNILDMANGLLDPLTSLRRIDLRFSNVKTFPIGSLEAHIFKKEFTIELNGTNWICDCRAHYLVEANKIAKRFGNNDLIDRDLICGYPLKYKAKRLLTDQIKLCPHNNNEMKCPALNREIPNSMNKIDFDIFWTQNNKVSFIVSKKYNIRDDLVLVLFKGSTLNTFKNNFSCLPITNTTIIIENLLIHSDYTFCIVSTEYDTQLFLPFNCITLQSKTPIYPTKHCKFDDLFIENIWIILPFITLGVITITFGIAIILYHKQSTSLNSELLQLQNKLEVIVRKRYLL